MNDASDLTPLDGSPLDLMRALSRVAVRSALLRDVRLAEWGGKEVDAEARAWALLIEALDELELAEPGTAAELSGEVERVIAGWRAELDLGGR
jgi:hypothetical protein